jgi:transcriptional regulator with XRE-family HTH domain
MSETLSDRVKRLVVESGLTHAEIEARGRLPKNAVADLLRNLKKTGNMTVRTAERLSAALGVSPDVILHGEDVARVNARFLEMFLALDQGQRDLVMQIGETLLANSKRRADGSDQSD